MTRKKVIFKIYSGKPFYFLVLLLFAGGLSFLTSCSEQKNISLRYKMEKNFYKSERMRSVLSINLKAATPEDFKKLIHSYQEVVDLASSVPKTSLAQEISDLASSAQLRIAELYILQKDLDSAQKSLKQVLDSYPQSIPQKKNALFNLAEIYERKNQKEKAVEAYHHLLENYPPIIKSKQPDLSLLFIPNHLIQLFSPKEEKTNRDSEFEYAQKYYRDLIQAYPNTQVSFVASLGLARAYQMQNRWKESVDILETAKDSTGQTPGSVFLQIGNIYYDQLKDEKNALSVFNQVLDSSPDSSSRAEAQMKIGLVYFAKKDYAKAREELSKVKKFFPTQGRMVATSQYLIAQIYEETGEWERALNEYNWLIVNYSLTPEGLEAPLRIAAYYQKENPALASEHFEKGSKHYDELLNKYKDKPFALLVQTKKAKLYFLQKDWNKAIVSLQEIAENHPGTDAGLSALLSLWRIYKIELRDEIKSNEILSRIRSDYPGVIPDTLMGK